MKVFISCASKEFRSYRLRLANQLHAVRGIGFDVKVQEDFQQGGFTLLEALADYIRDCDWVVHLAGEASGDHPTEEHERALLRHLGEPDATPAPGYSYTQWEYHLARRFGKRALVYVTDANAAVDCERPVDQPAAERASQQRHLAALDRSGEHRTPILNVQHFIREVFRDLNLSEDRKIDNLPFASIGSLFKGREGFLAQLREKLGGIEHRGHRRVAAITAKPASVHGLGGIGKTRAAIEYARRYADEFTALLFVQASSPAALQSNLAALCGPMLLNLPEQDEREAEKQVTAALRWLQQHPGWFLLFDNVDSEDAAREVENLVASLSQAGQVLITSRISRWSRAVEPLELDVLALDDATEFLLERTERGRRPLENDAALARETAELLGQLALALEQAGAMIDTQRLTFAKYLEKWRSQQEKVLAWFDEREMQYPCSVAVTWQTSFEQLSENARTLLKLVCWYAPDPIPESLLEVPIPDAPLSADDLLEALADLERYSLATRSGEADAPAFAVHRLVQDVTRLQDGKYVNILKAALRWINDAFVGKPQDVRDWPKLDPLAPHARVVADRGDEAEIAEPTARLMNELGQLLNSRARWGEAEPLMRRALAIGEAAHGPEHPAVAACLNNLASLLLATNRQGEAEPLMRRVVTIYEKHYGEEDPRVATALNNMAQLLLATNRLGEAEPLMRRALAIDEESFGPEHPKVATRLNNLAQLLQDTNRLGEAEPLMRRALAIDEAFYGPEDPNVATDLNNLAALLMATNRLGEAEPLMRRALAIGEASYGPEHPEVARDLNNLAELLRATNRLGEAEPLMRRAILIYIQFTRATGHEHPNRVVAFQNYKQLLRAMGKSEKEIQGIVLGLVRGEGGKNEG